MTECERIIQSGRISADYLKEETKNDFFINSCRKKIWAIELDLLLEFDRICRKHNIKYFLMGGSLIGAIRHKGIIPWDDDIDVAMLREDYEKFIKIGADELDDPYMLQLPSNDEDYYYSFAKMRNKNTTGVVDVFKYCKFNQGLYIDIFPLDNCMLNDLEERFNKIRELIKENSTYMRMSNPELGETDRQRVAGLSGRDPMDIFKEINQLATQYRGVKTEYVNTAVLTAYKYNSLLYKKEWLDEVIYTEFEGYMLPIPKGYDDVLKAQYGDYMKLPPVAERGMEHIGITMDPDTPYNKFKTKGKK